MSDKFSELDREIITKHLLGGDKRLFNAFAECMVAFDVHELSIADAKKVLSAIRSVVDVGMNEEN